MYNFTFIIVFFYYFIFLQILHFHVHHLSHVKLLYTHHGKLNSNWYKWHKVNGVVVKPQ